MNHSPIIIIGMHRSGTSMLTRFISDLGVFMGNDKSENDESKFFQNVNRWLLYQSGASWDTPLNSNNLNPYFIEKSSQILEDRLQSIWSVKYLGLNRFLKYRGILNTREPWGWKDPRNTLLLPIYKKVFPNAKIVHIYRNPIDVAVSLQKRENKKKQQNNSKKEKLKIFFLKYERVINHSLVVEDLKKGINLWEFYTEKSFSSSNYFDDVIHIKYEDFLEDPRPVLHDLSRFLNIDPNEGLINNVVEKVNPNRSYAFRTNDEYLALYNKMNNKPLMKKLGYNSIIK
ncbi:sulfotransferase [Hanstruepera ponticola]|uniref:sulfotransferase n=1 Tax=Hanstruepera ponticola TaxID=2042995 RepID=UPI000CF02E18|nr:sulfotransferase [Hanstruepera ponticola]